MFVRRKKNRSGSTSIHVIDKIDGFKVIATMGTSRDPDEIKQLVRQGQQFITEQMSDTAQIRLLSLSTLAERAITRFVDGLVNTGIHTIGPELIFGTLFDRIGFNQIKDQLFRHLVIARLAYPTSKLKTVDYLYRYKGITVSVDAIYKFMDRLDKRYESQVEAITYQHTKRRLKNISVVFYDMTTLYFEAEDEDDLRKIGFSKDGKFQQPQIMLGLLVGEEGRPIGYDIFEGNTFEGHTLLPILQSIQKKHTLSQPIVVADAAMLSKENLIKLGEAEYHFIIGARIKNESDDIKAQVMDKSQGMNNGDTFIVKRQDGTRLIVTYSDKRAGKDTHNRNRGIKRLKQRIRTGKLTKQSINNRGYNKFLSLTGEVSVELDETTIEEDKKWDGLKGYITNTRLGADRVLANYSHLWRIEKAFRISKTDLRIRPIYHYRKRRIEAHICIAFVAYAIYQELELLLKKKGITMSAHRAGELTHTMYEMQYQLPDSKQEKRQILKMDEEQQVLYEIVNTNHLSIG